MEMFLHLLFRHVVSIRMAASLLFLTGSGMELMISGKSHVAGSIEQEANLYYPGGSNCKHGTHWSSLMRLLYFR